MPFRLDRRAAAVALVFCLMAPIGAALGFSTDWPAPPSVEFGELYRAVEMAGLFADQKAFADAAPRAPPAEVMADYDREKGQPGFDLKAFVDASFQPAAAGFPGLPAPTGRGRPRLRARFLAGATAQTGRGRALVVAAAARPPLCRPGRPLSRDLLLGQLFRHARPPQRRPPRPRPRHARQFRLADRPLRPYPQRQPQLLPQPVAAAVLLADGRTDRRPGGGRGPDPIPAGARGRIRLLDGRRRRRSRPGRPSATSSGCPTASCSIGAGTIAPRRATNPIARMSRRRGARTVRPTRCTAISGPGRRRDGTSAPAGSPTARRSRPYAPPRSPRST